MAGTVGVVNSHHFETVMVLILAKLLCGYSKLDDVRRCMAERRWRSVDKGRVVPTNVVTARQIVWWPTGHRDSTKVLTDLMVSCATTILDFRTTGQPAARQQQGPATDYYDARHTNNNTEDDIQGRQQPPTIQHVSSQS